MTVAVIMHPPFGESPGERLVREARIAAAFDLAVALRRAGVEEVLVVSRDEKMAGIPGELLAPATDPFHCGDELKSIVARFGIERLLYFGSGNGMLLSEAELARMIEFTSRPTPSALFNNFYSCDFAAISHASAILAAALPRIDNGLGFALADAGFSCFSLPRRLSTQFDLDTPAELFLLAAAGRGGDRLRTALARFGLHHPKLPGLEEALTSRKAHVCLIGRINPRVWADFERGVACRTSAISEGRGMRAYPDGRGTIAGEIIRRDGPAAFVARISADYDGAIIDTRPFLSSGGLPSRADRFASDLLRPELIADQGWAEFTRAVIDAPIPIVIGGHSLVSGGLYLLSEIAWKGGDLPRRLHPETIDWEKETP